MMNNEILKHEEFGTLRVHYFDGEPWFSVYDVCRALDLKNSCDAIRQLNEDKKKVVYIYTFMEKLEMLVVSVSGLSHLIFKKYTEEAKRFTDWVTSEMKNVE